MVQVLHAPGDNIQALAGAVEDLRHAVTRVLRTATAEVDRRAVPRYFTRRRSWSGSLWPPLQSLRRS
jgi:hypothetical protein